MAKLKSIWIDVTPTTRRCHYGHVTIRIHHERQKSLHGGDKFRLKCLAPKRTKLGCKLTYTDRQLAERTAENEAKRIYQNRAPIDFERIEEWREKAERFDKVADICDKIGREPDQAAYELVDLYEVSGKRRPMDLVSKWLDEFERVKNPMSVDSIVKIEIARVEKSKSLAPSTKRTNTNILLAFAEKIGGERMIGEVSVDELEDYYFELNGGLKWAYDCWLVVRSAVWLAHKRYGAVTKWVFDQVMELDFSAKANYLNVLMPLEMLRALFTRCEYLNDALYLAILSWAPLRRAELHRLNWAHLEDWSDGLPHIFHLPAVLTKGEKGFQEERFVDIPPNLAKILAAFRQESGPIIVGDRHQQRLAELAKSIDPKFVWVANILRRSCISNGVADTGDKVYWQKQAGHNEEAQGRYLRPVDPKRAKAYRNELLDIERLKKLPRSELESPVAGRRSKLETPEIKPDGQPAERSSDSTRSIKAHPPVPAPERWSDGLIAWKQIKDEFLLEILKKHELSEIATAWGTSEERLSKLLARRGIEVPKTVQAAPTGDALKPGNEAVVPQSKLGQRPVRRTPQALPPKIQFYQFIWTEPVSAIAQRFGRSKTAIQEWGHAWFGENMPSHGFWRSVKCQGVLVVPLAAKKFYLELRAAADPKDVPQEIPEIFRIDPETKIPVPTQSATEASAISQQNLPSSATVGSMPAPCNPPSPAKVTVMHLRHKFETRKGDFVRELWLKPISLIARENHCGATTIARFTHQEKFPKRPTKFWLSLKHNDPIIIPPDVLRLIELYNTGADESQIAELVAKINNDHKSDSSGDAENTDASTGPQ